MPDQTLLSFQRETLSPHFMPHTKLFINLFRNADTAPFTAGQTIFGAQDTGFGMYVIADGEVDILIGSKLLETLGPGEIFGEMALIDDGPRSAVAVAKTGCKLVWVDRRRFEFMVSETPFFALAVMEILASRLRKTNAKVAAE